MKTLLLLLLTVSCAGEGIPTSQNGALGNFNVQRLFETEGCVVYRFYDARYRYFTNCNGAVNYSASCGKNCTRNEEIPTTGRSK